MVDLGLLVLRVTLAVLLAGHGLQKALGWFRGPGVTTAAEMFDSWGFVPGRRLVVLAAGCELAAAALVALGLLTPIAAAIVVGTMIVAASPSVSHGLWAARGGYELPLVYALLGAVLGLSGPGAFSLDTALALPVPPWSGFVAIAVGVGASAPPLLARRATLRQRGRDAARQVSSSPSIH